MKINLIDTPGRRSFGGEVERVLKMADALCCFSWMHLKGPMPQTRFVLGKAIELGLKPIVVVNKVDKENCTPDLVQEQVFDLMFNLDATEEQLDFPTVYGSAKNGWIADDWQTPKTDVTHLLDVILEHVPEAPYHEGTPQLQITSLDYSKYTGRIAIGRLYRGDFACQQGLYPCTVDGNKKVRAKELFVFSGLGKERWTTSEAAICAPSPAWMGLKSVTRWPTSNNPKPWSVSRWTNPPRVCSSRSTPRHSWAKTDTSHKPSHP